MRDIHASQNKGRKKMRQRKDHRNKKNGEETMINMNEANVEKKCRK